MINYDYITMWIIYFLRLSFISIQKNQTTGAKETKKKTTVCGICCIWISVRESANIVLIPYAIPINANVIAIAAITTIKNSFAFIIVAPFRDLGFNLTLSLISDAKVIYFREIRKYKCAKCANICAFLIFCNLYFAKLRCFFTFLVYLCVFISPNNYARNTYLYNICGL